MGAVFRWIKYIYEWCKNFAYKLSGSGLPLHPPYDQGVQFYVDGDKGLDTNDGLSWAKAVKTIAHARSLHIAIIEARGWVVGEYNTIWIRPGRYAEHDIGFPLFCHVIGLGIHGTDTQTQIRMTPAEVAAEVATGVAVTCIFGPATENAQAVHLANLWMELPVDDAAIIDARELNSCLIEDCVFRPGGGVDVVGIRTAVAAGGAKRPEIRRCSFETGDINLAHGMLFQGEYLQNARIHDNDIFAKVGIEIAAATTPAQAVIKHNAVAAEGVGINDLSNKAWIVDNTVFSEGADAIAGLAAQILRNRVWEGGVAAWE